MAPRARSVLVMIAGSFLIYCGQTSTLDDDAGPNDGFVGDADAANDDCGCAVAPTFTKLADVVLAPVPGQPSVLRSEPIAVGAFREVLVYRVMGPEYCVPILAGVGYRFRPDASTPFGSTSQDHQFGRIRVDGSDMYVDLADGGCGALPLRIIVAGVR